MFGEEAFSLDDIPFFGPRFDGPRFDEDCPPEYLYGAPVDGETRDPAAEPVSLLDAWSHFTEEFVEHLLNPEVTSKSSAGDPTKAPTEAKDSASGMHESGNTTIKGGVNANGSTASAGFETKHTSDTATGREHVKVGADAKVTRDGAEASMSAEGGSSKIDHEKEKQRTAKENAELLDFERKKANGELPHDAKFEPSDEAKAKPAAGSSTKASVGGGYSSEEGGHGKASVQHERTDESGAKTSAGASAKVGYGPDGHNASLEGNLDHTGPDGKKKSASAGIDVDGKGVAAKASIGDDKGGIGGEVISKEGEDGARANVKIEQFQISGGHIVKFLPPAKLPNGSWSVTYVITDDAAVGAKTSEGKSSVGVNVSGRSQISKTRTFASEAEALAFRKAENVGDVAFPQSAESASSLKPGEKVVMSDTATTGVDASVSISQAGTASGGYSHSEGERTSVEMNADHSVFAERTATVDDTGKLGYAAPGGLAGISGSRTSTQTVITKIKVDLGTNESPNAAGRQAYADFMASGIVAPPAQVVSRTKSDGTKTGREISIGPVKGFEINEVTDSVTYDEDGKFEETIGERQRGWEIKALGMGGKYGTKLDALERNDEKRAFIITSTVEQQDAHASMERLNDVTKGGMRGEEELVGQKSSGKWEVQSMMDPSAVDQFVAQVQKGNYNPQLVTNEDGKVVDQGRTHTYFSAGDDLKEALKEAGNDKDKQRKALAQFVADGGEDAVAQMRALGGGNDEAFVTLRNGKNEVDPNFRGVQGRLEMESTIARLQTRSESGGDPAVLLADVKAAAAKARSRISAITPERYPDLPPGVMATEIGRSQKDLDRLEALAAPLRVQMNEDRLAKLSPQERAARAKQTEVGMELEEISGNEGSSVGLAGEAKTDPGMKQAMKMKQMAAVKAATEKERTAARAAQKLHTGAGWKSTSRRPRDRIADSDERWSNEYATADGDVATGHATFTLACAQETAAYAMPETDDANISASISCVATAITLFDSAKASFANAIAAYRSIAAGNPDEIK